MSRIFHVTGHVQSEISIKIKTTRKLLVYSCYIYRSQLELDKLSKLAKQRKEQLDIVCGSLYMPQVLKLSTR